MAELHAEIQKT